MRINRFKTWNIKMYRMRNRLLGICHIVMYKLIITLLNIRNFTPESFLYILLQNLHHQANAPLIICQLFHIHAFSRYLNQLEFIMHLALSFYNATNFPISSQSVIPYSHFLFDSDFSYFIVEISGILLATLEQIF